MTKSKIEWTDRVWNPTRGCDKISPGCKHCYAETFAERWRGVSGHAYEQGFDLRLAPHKLAEPLRWRKPSTVFVNSMSDLFHEDVPNEYIGAVFGVMAIAKQHTFQVLTKRARRLFDVVGHQEHGFINRSLGGIASECIRYDERLASKLQRMGGRAMPSPNVWLGVSIENADYLWRADRLRKVPAAVRFLSLEPLLGPIDLRGKLDGIHWVIAGCESKGSKPGRPAKADWFRAIRDACVEAGVPFFLKQHALHEMIELRPATGVATRWSTDNWNASLIKGTPPLDGKVWDQMPVTR